jgi:hypothetical protein
MQKAPNLRLIIGGSSSLYLPRLWPILLIAIGLWGQQYQAARADLILYVDFDPHTDGIQNSLTILQGDSFTANLILEFSGVTSGGLDSYRFSVGFDSTAMSFGSANSIPLAGFTPTSSSPELVGLNQVTPFEASSLDIGNGPATPLSALVGSIDFTAGMTLGTFIVAPYEDDLLDGSFDNQLNQITPMFNSGSVTITAVPEPSSMCLMLTVLPMAAAFHQRSRRRPGTQCTSDVKHSQ